LGHVLGIPTLGWPELLLILAALLLLFGARKLPEIAKSLGKSTQEFKSGMRQGADPEPEEPEQAEKTSTTEKSATTE
jgi:sec-independent protein translocase protein TatA